MASGILISGNNTRAFIAKRKTNMQKKKNSV